jgi:alpha-L-arabinofuranosidase
MRFMQEFSGRRLVAIVFVFSALANSFLAARGQTASTPTVINVTSQVQQPAVTRFGINLEDQTYWDSGQIMKNLAFINPGFEPMSYRSILQCVSVTANTCTDVNIYSPMGTNYWRGGAYQVISGAASGTTGSILSSTAAVVNVGPGISVTFDKNVNMAVGDYVVVKISFPGNGQNGWWTSLSGGGTITSETTDLSPNTAGTQALSLNASGAGQYASVIGAWDTLDGHSFIQMNGAYQLTFRAKGIGGSNQMAASVYRFGEPAFVNTTITLTPSWQDYTLTFNANETGTSVGHAQVSFIVNGASAELDDVSVMEVNTDPTNPTVFRDEVVNTLKSLQPGTIRMYGGSSIGSNLYDEIAPMTARYPSGVITSQNSIQQVSFGIPEFLQLCQVVGADPWITVPTATTPQEMTDFMDYLTGDGSTKYSAMRVAAGQTAPWPTVFKKIHLELGNETWNGMFMGDIMSYPAYPQWANQVFGAARQSPNYEASKFDLVLSGFAASWGYTQGVLQSSTQHDSIDMAPYLMFGANNDTIPHLFSSLFAEPEMFDSPGGEAYQNVTVAQQTLTSASGVSKPTGISVYEVNMSTQQGSITQSELNQFETSLGAGIAVADHLLQMMRDGVSVQNVFGLTSYEQGTTSGGTVYLFGTVLDMGGPTNRRRPSFIAEQLANQAVQGDMLATQQSGANPTWNQPLSSDNVQYNGAHYIQSFSFLNGLSHSLVLFNLNQTTALPVTFTGANAPIGAVQVTLLNSTNITDTNETADLVQPVTNSLSSFNPTVPYSLPAHSMTVLTWTATGTETGGAQAAAPVLSVASGTYPTAQTVTITESSPGAAVYYTIDGSTPTSSSSLYTTPIVVSSSETLTAVAMATDLATSPVVSATYAISATLPLPVMMPVSGTYANSETVTLTASPGAAIYYTTNGSTPTTSSSIYSAPLTVTQAETVQAIAVAPGYANTPVVSASYVIVPGAVTVNFASGFTAQGLTFNGGAQLKGTAVQLTDGGEAEARSMWYATQVPVKSFITDFKFLLQNANANGVTFTIQNSGTSALGSVGSGLGYQGTPKSVAVKFDLFNAGGEGPNSTGVYTNGASPTVPAVDLTPTGVSLHSGDLMQAHIVYDGTYLTLTITDTVTYAQATEKFAVNIPSIVGGGTAYIGFTAATGGETASQNILNLTHVDTSGNAAAASAPLFSVPGGTYTSAQTVSITDPTPNATIYYTTNGSAPTTSSSVYSGPLTVNSTETVNAIAAASGYTASGVSTAAYTINLSSAASPVFSVATGTYSGTQTVAIADSTPGAAIYYTTNGSSPTASSALYTGAISISATTTLNAIAVASGYNNSGVSSATYTIKAASSNTTSGSSVINFANGFTSTSGLHLNGGAQITGGLLQLTDGRSMEARSAWSPIPVSVAAFTTDFTFQLLNATADGFTFTVQNMGPTALGYEGGSLGYQGIGASVAVKFDLYNNGGEGNDSTGIYEGGGSPTVPATDLSSTGINLHSGDTIHAHIAYDGAYLVLTLTDTVTSASVIETYPVNIPQVISSGTAYVGFTAGSGGATAIQDILTWTYTTGTVVGAPTFSPAGSTYIAAQTVTISDLTPGASIHYTTNGTVPTASSPTYTAPITVSSTETVQAIAVLSGSVSGTASATYAIVPSSSLISYASGFTTTGLQLNGGATVTGNALVLTDGRSFEARSAWYTTQVPVDSFTTDFSFLLTNATADGFTFTIQNGPLTAIGGQGGSLGYAGIGKSVAVKFDLYNNSGEGPDSTGVYTHGVSPTVPATDLSSTGINLHSGHLVHVHMTYDGTMLVETLTDTVTNATVTEQYPVNIPAVVGSSAAYVGFTGGSGGGTAVQAIQNWTYVSPCIGCQAIDGGFADPRANKCPPERFSSPQSLGCVDPPRHPYRKPDLVGE